MIKHSQLLIAVAALAAMPAFAQDAPPAPVQLNPTRTLAQSEFARIKVYADNGMESLRRYLWRTRAIYNYNIAELTGSTG